MLWRHFSFTAIWAFIVLILYSLPSSSLPAVHFWQILEPDKIAHAGVFFILICSLSVSLYKQTKFKKLKSTATLSGFIIASCYGLTLELLQGSLFEGRVTDILDVLANEIGIILGIVILKVIFKGIIT